VPASSADIPALTGCAVLVPVKAFGEAKARMAPTLDPSQRAALARTMAAHVLAAARPLAVAVVCDDAEVMAWAQDHGALVLLEPGKGLNGAVSAGVRRLVAAGADEVLVAHADLPLATDLGHLAGFPGITLVPDRREDGTNVMCIPGSVAADFRVSYGPGSFELHRHEAERLGVDVRVVREPELTLDVDTPGDIPAGLAPPGRP
jgi:2-phospho-L-lactate/phosphoenolpyruvate guanylyltransferase